MIEDIYIANKILRLDNAAFRHIAEVAVNEEMTAEQRLLYIEDYATASMLETK